ncbi:hypothetical protein KQI65_12480 [bacterium]|nr:hypothetical protein [bacterium]
MRELDITIQTPWQKRQTLLFVAVCIAIVALFVYTMSFAHPSDSIWSLLLRIWFIYVLIIGGYRRARYVKAQYVRIHDGGMSWRLTQGYDNNIYTLPQLSTGDYRWEEIENIWHSATGMHISIKGMKEEFYVALSVLSYVQRQEIKAALAEHFPAGAHSTGEKAAEA